MSQGIWVEWKGGQGQKRSSCIVKGLAPGRGEVRAAPSGKIMIKVPDGNSLTIPMLPWLGDSVWGASPESQLPDERQSLGAGLSR